MYNLNFLRSLGGDGHPSVPQAERDHGVCEDDIAPWLDIWRNGTEQARRRTAEVRVNIAYGNRENERIDLYLPTHEARNLPFAVFVHGGDWRQATRAHSGFPAKAFHHHGAAFVAVGFDPVPDVDLAGQVDQVRRAWRYLVANAEHLGLDPSRGHLVGHASGAHLAALAAFDPQGTPPASAVLLSGVYDLEQISRSGQYPHLGLDRETAIHLSPIRCVRSAVPAVLVAWGARGSEPFRRQSESFARACKMRGLRTIQGPLPGRGHFDLSLELADRHSQVFATLRG
jgi:arylformamidase